MNQNLTVYQMLEEMTDAEVAALCRLKDIVCLGDGLLRELCEAASFEYLSRLAEHWVAANVECLNRIRRSSLC